MTAAFWCYQDGPLQFWRHLIKLERHGEITMAPTLYTVQGFVGLDTGPMAAELLCLS
jgi:hypothetical protein